MLRTTSFLVAESKYKLSGQINFLLMGLSSLIGYNAIISDLSYFSLKYTSINNVPFKLPV